ncbi:MAG: hypothetical protein FJ308_21850 [Planctomycetes bacterium]|nr:hypothetical protein [Planctomycetota bacterium]
MDESKVDGVDPLSVTKRLQRDGRWSEVEPVRDRLIKECRKQGMSKPDAQTWTYSELDRLYPPLGAQWTDDSGSQLGTVDGGNVTGLGDIPASWGELPSNATLQAEIAWCQANRLWIVEEKSDGATVVHLNLARSPAPSWSALGWLETSIRAYAKYVDVAAKVTATHQDQQDLVRRERMAIDEIRSLLAEMLEDNDER